MSVIMHISIQIEGLFRQFKLIIAVHHVSSNLVYSVLKIMISIHLNLLVSDLFMGYHLGLLRTIFIHFQELGFQSNFNDCKFPQKKVFLFLDCNGDSLILNHWVIIRILLVQKIKLHYQLIPALLQSV
jgi:hypothetical protein